MKVLHTLIISTCSLLMANQAWAYTYSDPGVITGMFTGANNVVGIYHAAAWYNPANCPNGASDKAYLIDYTSTDDWSKVTSMLLTAYTTGKPIRIAVSTTTCYAGYPVIERVAFGKGYRIKGVTP